MGDELFRKPKEAPKPELGDAVVRAADAALRSRKVNIGVPPDHEIFKDLARFAKGEGKPGSFASHPLGSRQKADAFVGEFRTQLRRAGILAEFETKVGFKAQGDEIVFTQKAVPVKLPSTKGMELAKVLETAIEAGALVAGISTGSKAWKREVSTFMDAYAKFLSARENKDNSSAALLLVLRSSAKDSVEKFQATFLEKIGESGRKLADFGLRLEPYEDAPNKYSVRLVLPELKQGLLKPKNKG